MFYFRGIEILMQDFHGLTTAVLLNCEYRQRSIICLTNVMELKSSICRCIKGSDTFSSSFQVGQTIFVFERPIDVFTNECRTAINRPWFKLRTFEDFVFFNAVESVNCIKWVARVFLDICSLVKSQTIT
ncbi:hypothetical protein CIP107534_01761 [Corynebacterium diphtheriae]|nr:hypothetical protein CIP107534_01761 [Corynebacterium diphtheriae]